MKITILNPGVAAHINEVTAWLYGPCAHIEVDLVEKRLEGMQHWNEVDGVKVMEIYWWKPGTVDQFTTLRIEPETPEEVALFADAMTVCEVDKRTFRVLLAPWPTDRGVEWWRPPNEKPPG